MDSIGLRLRDGKIIGHIEQGVAHIPVTAKNYLAAGKGFSLDGHVLEQIDEHACGHIAFEHTRNGRIWRISLEHFRRVARRFEFSYGTKWAAPLSACDMLATAGGAQ